MTRSLSLKEDADVKVMEQDIRFLVNRAKEGDLMALSRLYELNFRSIYRYVFAKVGNKHDAEDITSQTFLKMIDSIDMFSWRKVPFKAWLIKIAHNLAIDHFRKVKKEQNVEPWDTVDDLEDKAIDGMMVKEVLNAVEKLDEKYRSVLLLRFIAGLSSKEASAFMGVSQDNIRTMQHRALKMLRGKL